MILNGSFKLLAWKSHMFKRTTASEKFEKCFLTRKQITNNPTEILSHLIRLSLNNNLC